MSPSPSLSTSSSLGATLAAAGLILTLPHGAKADSLAEAIALAYDSNPTLLSQRALLQATDEGYVQAEAGFRPTVSGQASTVYSKSPQSNIFLGEVETESNTGAVALSVNQPLYTGGRTTSQVHAAEAQIRAGREQLRSVEANVMFGVIQAYCDVLRDRAALTIQRDSLKSLQDAVDEIRARSQAGANTVTDVYQADAQLQGSKALVASAEAQLDVSNAEYVTAVGQSPGDLAPLPPLPDLPVNVDNAFDIADRESPAIRQAQYAEAASRAQVQEARAAGHPTVSLNGTIGYDGPVEPFDSRNYQRAVSLSATLNQPIFTGGVTASQVRQALAQDTSARVQVDVAKRVAIQSVSQTWSQRRAAHLNTVSEADAVRAAQATFDGMRVEFRAGLRQTLDVLIAQETLRDAQIALAGAQHDEYIAEASLLGAVGRLEARILVQGVPLYQPQASFRRIEHIGDVPWSIIPATLDKIGAPGLPQPGPIPELASPSGPVRMTPVAVEAAQ